jgi:hypothetical protein
MRRPLQSLFFAVAGFSSISVMLAIGPDGAAYTTNGNTGYASGVYYGNNNGTENVYRLSY